MKHPRATAWGAGIMGVAGLLGSVLGPSPLLLPFAPLISVAYAPFAVATSALGMPAGLANLGLGGKTAFVVWCALLGAAGGRLLGAATLDRLRHGAYRLTLEGESYRSPRPIPERRNPTVATAGKTKK